MAMVGASLRTAELLTSKGRNSSPCGATSSARLTERQHGGAGSEKIRSKLLRSRCYTDRVMMMERRVAARKRVLKNGMVELRESALPCKIIDLSDTGAGLALSGASHVPNFFTLLIPDYAPVFCQIIWRRQERLGVTFRELRDLGLAR